MTLARENWRKVTNFGRKSKKFVKSNYTMLGRGWEKEKTALDGNCLPTKVK